MAYIPVAANALLLYKKVTLSSANILSLKTTPITIVAAPGSGIILVPFSAIAVINYGSTPYVAAGIVSLYHSTTPILTFPSFLAASTTTIVQGLGVSPTLLSNTAINASITSADPITGNSTVDIHLWYNALTL